MRADSEDRLRPISKRDGFPLAKLLIAVAVLAGLLLFWLWGDQRKPAEMASSAPPAVVSAIQPETTPAPDIPQRPEPDVVVVPDSETMVEQIDPAGSTLPTPQESDEIFLRQLDMVGADANLKKLVSKEHPLDVSAALIDGMSRGMILRKILPANPPGQAFSVIEEGHSIYMNPASYERYDSYAKSIASLDSDRLVDAFHTLRPLYERAYEQLGLDAEDFDNAVIRTLDVILETPEIDGAIELKRKSVMYTYADPELESLPPAQKQLMRMGPDNIRLIKQQVQTIRDGLLTQ